MVYSVIFSFNKIFWLIIILLIIWYGFKFIEKRNKNLKKSKKNNDDKENIEAFQCKVCGLWSTEESCDNEKCPLNN